MDARVFEFANALRKHAGVFGSLQSVEWRYDDTPVAYPQAVSEMEARVAAIAAGKAPELIWFLEHPPLYTAGTSAVLSDLLDPSRFPVFQAGRGGQYTYHGPGQLVAYVLFDLNRRSRDVRRFVHGLEDWVIAALADYGVSGRRREGYPGIWLTQKEGLRGTAEGRHSVDGMLSHESLAKASASSEAKIAAVGVRVRRWVTYHGVAINICPDLSHFTGIVPCGIAGAGVTSLEEIELSRKAPTKVPGARAAISGPRITDRQA